MEGNEPIPVPRDALELVLSAVLGGLEVVPVLRHPLGFLYFGLAQLVPLDGGSLRLHVWDEQSHPPDELGLFHDHAWSLRSLVLWGSIEDSQYTVEYEPAGESEEILVRYGHTIERTSEGARAHLRLQSVREIHAGARYDIEPGVVHSTNVTKRPAVTLVRASAGILTTARVFAAAGNFAGGHSSRPSVSVEEARARLTGVLDSTQTY